MNTGKGAQTRARIIEAGLDLFLAEGTANVSLRQIATAAGVTPMAIYRHFDDKAALQLALLDSAFNLFESYLKSAEDASDPLARLHSLGDRFFEFALTREAQFRFLFLSDVRPAEAEHRETIRAMSRPTFLLLRDAVRDCRDTGLLRVPDLHLATVDILAFCVGQAALVLSGNLAKAGPRARKEAGRALRRYTNGFTRD